MIFPSDFQQRLGFDQVSVRLAEYCLGEPGRFHVRQLQFLTDAEIIRAKMILCQEVVSLKEQGEDLPIAHYDDPETWRDRLEVAGSYLDMEELFALSKALQMSVLANEFLLKDPESAPALSRLALPASTGKQIHSKLRTVLDDEGNVKDHASPALSRARKRLREQEVNARRIADHILRSALENGWCPDGAQPTIREGRLVIPLLAEHKRRLKGYLVDQSSTGQTVYVEPTDVMEANNELRDLLLEERNEVVRILREMTAHIHEHLGEFNACMQLLADLDFIRAKARLARDLNAVMPELSPSPALSWREARHPLLFLAFRNKRTLVPLSISLTDRDRFLLVSGPNAGGKSVCLKTVGLIQYMAQCGLLVPINPDSVVGVFDSIFLDIGDQQSIESDLSTYSSHLKNMATFLTHGNERSLILLDELGSGTDPNFGGGIAQAILARLVSMRTWGLATTHYYNLKAFASHTVGVRNASMQFDAEKLMPLFQLEMGQPGSSFALEIAGKTGLPADTLKAAEAIIGRDLIGLETLMKQVAEEKLRLTEREKEAAAREQEVNASQHRYELLNEKLETQKKEIINQAKSEAAFLLKETNREIEKTIRHIRENKAEKKETRKVRKELDDLQLKVKPSQGKTTEPMGPVKVGDKVRMMGGEVTGTVLTVSGKKATVQFGSLRSSVLLERLVHSDQAEPRTSSSTGMMPSRTTAFSPQLDVRGMRVEELLPVLIRFMDDAVQFGVTEVTILHGKGEGVLRKVVRDYLKQIKSVASFRDEHADRGGAGVTLISIK